MNKKIYRKIFLGLTLSTTLIPISMSASCHDEKKSEVLEKMIALRNQIQDVNPNFIKNDILKVKFPDEKLTHLKPLYKNYTSEALWCLDAYDTPQDFSFERKKFKINVNDVIATPGTDETNFTLRIQSVEFPELSIKAQITVDYFKETPINHNHFVKILGQKISLKECMKKYNYTEI